MQADGQLKIRKVFNMNSTLILIGPLGAGKSTVGHLLAEKLGRPQCSVDDIRWKYYEESGYDHVLASQIATSDQGAWGKLRYSKPFDVHVVERVLSEHSGGIIDFGASNSVYDDELLFSRVENALASCPNVILLLPSADMDESAEILNARLTHILKAKGEEINTELLDLNEYFIKHPSNYQLAKMVIYTKEKTPEEIRDEILQRLVQPGDYE
jgi:adenylate kinase family enzyme